MSMPSDPITQMAAGAVSTHEMFTSYVEAGFTEEQALALVQSILAAVIARIGQD